MAIIGLRDNPIPLYRRSAASPSSLHTRPFWAFCPGDRIMRIAQVAPLSEAVPPKLYGGTERIVSYLTEALVGLGHDVTFVPRGDSVTRAKLTAIIPHALRLSHSRVDAAAAHAVLLQTVAQSAARFDIIHCHTDWLHLAVLHERET